MSVTQQPTVIATGDVDIRAGDGTVDLVIGLPDGAQVTRHLTEAEAIDLCTNLMSAAMNVGKARKLVPSPTVAGELVPA